ncbi:MAG TPA: trigger factor [Oscillospiraceae bacterium]|nr:trigger factor [Oscillospiraceae bacterium]
MSLKSSNKVDTNRYQLEIEVDAKTFGDALTNAYKKESKKITIPGFRKGKAPRAYIEKYYGDKVFYEDAINAVYPDALDEAIKAAELEVIDDKIDFDMEDASKEGFTFKATVTTKPEVTIENYKGLSVSKKPVVVEEKDIDAEIEKVRDRNSRMVTVEDRSAQNGDIAVIDFDGYVDGTAFDGGKAENYSLTLGGGQFIPGFEDQVVGHSTGDEFDVNVTFPAEYQAKELAGKEAVFKIKLHEIKMKELPEVDDDFVKDVSEFDTLEKYKADIKTNLTNAREKEANDDVENQLIDQLIENMKAEIPDAMFQNKINEDIREFGYRLQSQGLDFDTYLKYTGMNKDTIRDSFKPQAERQVRVRLALEKIAQLENIQPTDEEMEAEFAKLAESYKIDVDKVKTFVPKEELAKDLSVEKAIGIVRDSANITEAANDAE